MRSDRWVAAAVVTAVLLAGCGSSTTASKPAGTTAPRSSTTTTGAAPSSAAATTTTTAAAGPASTEAPTTSGTGSSSSGPVTYLRADPGLTSDHQIQPTAIILHWWGYDGGNDIQSLVNGLLGQTGYYDPDITKAQYDANVASGQHGHTLGVQIGILDDGRTYQLTPELNSYAAHAACANSWAIGIEIEGAGPEDLRAHPAQMKAVEATVADLMHRYGIPLDGPLAADGHSGSGVHSHKEVDVNCTFADGSYAGQGKDDVDDQYLAAVKADLRAQGLGG